MPYSLTVRVILPVVLFAWSAAALSSDEAAPAPAGLASASAPAAAVSSDRVYEALHKGTALYAARAYAEAYPLLKFAATHGLPQAQARIGYLHMTGRGGVRRDSRLAMGWLGVAAESGDADIRKTFDDAWKKVPPEHVPAYHKVVLQFIARYGSDSQGMDCRNESRLGSTVRSLRCLVAGANDDVIADSLHELERNSSTGLSGEGAIREMADTPRGPRG